MSVFFMSMLFQRMIGFASRMASECIPRGKWRPLAKMATQALAGLALLLLAPLAHAQQGQDQVGGFVPVQPQQQAAPSPIIRGDRPVFGAPPSGVPGQRTRSFLPRSSQDGGPVTSVATNPSAQVAPADVMQDGGGVLRRLPVNMHGYRLRGEIDAAEWPVYLTDTQASAKVRFKVSYLTAISVMPEASVMSVLINDVVVGQTNVQAPNAPRSVVFEVPAELLRGGWNSVRITADMRHRVDCSLGATYELWTQLDPSNTGLLIYGAPDTQLDASDIASLPADAHGAFPIRAIIPGKTSLANVDMVVRAVQGIALHGRFLQPIVDFGPSAGGDAGMNLLVGVYADLAKQPGIERVGLANGPTVTLLPPSDGRRATLVITGGTLAEVQDAMVQFSGISTPRGTASGLAALSVYRGYRVQGGEHISLRKLNMPSMEFSGRLFRMAFDIVMPADFYSSDYAKVLLDLDGGYAAGLGPEPQISVSVNGSDAATIILPRSGGDVFKQNQIPFPLGHLRPGFNRIEILARVPTPADKSCDPLSALTAKKRFLLLDTSEIIIPTLARAPRMPNLALLSSAGFPLADSDPPPKLFIPVPDKETTGAAATLAAQFALAADKPINMEITLTPPEGKDHSTVLVAPASGLTPATLTAIGVNPDSLLAAWKERTDGLGRNFDPQMTRLEAVSRERISLTRNRPGYCVMPAFSKPGVVPRQTADAANAALSGRAPSDFDSSPVPTADLLAEWNHNVNRRTSLFAQVQNLFNTVAGWGHDLVAAGRGLISRERASTPQAVTISPQSSLVMGQSMLASSGPEALVVVTAPTGADLSEAMACLVDPAVWRQVGGQLSALDASDGVISRIAPRDARFASSFNLSLVNARLIVASWLSHNPSVYVVSSLLVAIFLGVTTTWLLRNIGRRQ